MSPFQWFSLSLRIIGAWTLVTGLELAVSTFNMVRGLTSADNQAVWAYFNQVVAHLVIGLLLFKFAPSFARLAYARNAPVSTKAEREQAADA